MYGIKQLPHQVATARGKCGMRAGNSSGGLVGSRGLVRFPGWTAWLIACLACSGCQLVKGIFKAGVWTGVIGVLAVIALLIYGATKLARR
jgi:hypothetical protein